jgi:hypothetical protein
MDLLHEQELADMKYQYAKTIIAVSLATYGVAIGLVIFVDRQKIQPPFAGFLAHLPRFGNQSEPQDGPSAETGEGEGKGGKDTKSGSWAALWPSSGLRLRQRRKKEKGKATEALEP